MVDDQTGTAFSFVLHTEWGQTQVWEMLDLVVR
jgi:hypothetical protein